MGSRDRVMGDSIYLGPMEGSNDEKQQKGTSRGGVSSE